VKYGIVGGGIAGLTAAYRLQQQGHEVSVFEARPSLGGQAATFECGGSRLEVFYHHLFSGDSDVIGLIDEMGLGDRLSWREFEGRLLPRRPYLQLRYPRRPPALQRRLSDRPRPSRPRRRLPAAAEGLASLRERHRRAVDQALGGQAQLRRCLGPPSPRQVRLTRR